MFVPDLTPCSSGNADLAKNPCLTNVPAPARTNCAVPLKPSVAIATVPVLNGSYFCSGLTSISVYCLAISAPPNAKASTAAVAVIPLTPALNPSFSAILTACSPIKAFDIALLVISSVIFFAAFLLLPLTASAIDLSNASFAATLTEAFAT